MTVYPNVKLNLGLRVLGRRPDGYHELETLFVPCDAFHDRLEISPSEVAGTVSGGSAPEAAFSLEISGPQYRGWAPDSDLVAKAWRLLREETLRDSALAALCPGGLPTVRARLEKNSPVGAGLGGGSADGAFMLLALNEMFSLGLSKARLAAIAARLGSDCPFFIYNAPMFATGRGEVLEPFALDLSGYRIEVAIPEGVAVSTAEAYAGLDAAQPASATCIPLREALALPVAQWRDAVVNDFERSVFPAHPEIAALKAEMYARGAVYAAMSGSGSAVFGLFPAA